MADSGPTYEEEQEALRQEQDGEVKINVPEPLPEVNPEVFKDVEPILFRGFVTQMAEINNVPFVFKSINHHEFELINLVTGGAFGKRQHNIDTYYNLFLSYGVLMIEGTNILSERDRHISDLTLFFSGLPTKARQKVIRHLSEINRRAYRAIVLTEAYVMEPASRLRWAQLQNVDLTTTAVTGLAGTASLGLNWGQLTWRALNYYEDLKYQSESDWENAKFVASSMAGKGMAKINAHDRDRRQKERDEKVARRDRLLRQVLLGESAEKRQDFAGTPMKVASTVAELAEQLENDLKGEKDWHDQVVDEYERRVRQGYEDKARRLQEIAEKHREESDGKAVSGGTELRGLKSHEVQERLLRRRQFQAQEAASKIVYPELYDEKYDEFMAKWNLPKAGAIGKTNKDPSSAAPLPPSRPRGTTWRGR